MNAPCERILRVGHGQFDPLSGELSLEGRAMKLRPRTAALLAHLVQHAGRVVGKNELMQAIWPDVVVTEDSLVQCVKEIRQALGDARWDWIRTVPRQGYAFVGNPPAAPGGPDQATAPLPSQAPSQSLPAPVQHWQAAAAPRRRLSTWGMAPLVVAAALAMGQWRSSQPERPPAPPLAIVVMPVVNLTGTADRENAADEMTEALTDALARVGSTIMVIAPSTAFTFKGTTVDVRRVGAELNVQYVLQGALRMDGAQDVLTMRLVDASNAAQLWNEDFTPGPAANTTARDLVIGRVASTLGLHLIRAEARRADQQRTAPPSISDQLSRARALMRWAGQGTEGIGQARTLLEQIVREDDGIAEAWGMLAVAYLKDVRFSATREQDLRRAAEAVDRAFALSPNSEAVRRVQGVLFYSQGRMPQALEALDAAVEINPNSPNAHATRGAALNMLGRPEEAIVSLERAFRLSPRDPQLPLWQVFAGVAHLHLGQDAQAVELFTRSVDGNPKSASGRLFLASALGISGRIPEAQAQMAQLLQMRPGFTLTRFRAADPSDPPALLKQRQRVYEGLRRAGMPE